jgi:serine/threonine protein kinase
MDAPRSTTLASKYEIIGKGGEGATARVYHGRDTATKTDVAIKVFYKSKLEPKEREHLKSETSILLKMSHPNVVRIIEVLEDPEHVFVIMEYCSGGELFERLSLREKYTERDAQQVLKSLADALCYCHSMSIVHRDLKPENILLATPDETSRVVLADFGYSKEIEEMLHSKVGTPYYTAPEIILHKPYDAAVDVWSFGVIVYILLCGTMPFSGNTLVECYTNITHCNYDFYSPDWDRVSEEAKDLVRKCLKLNPAERLTFTQILKHPWFESELADTNNITPAVDQLRAFQHQRMMKRAARAAMVTAHLKNMAVKAVSD